jgi:hypothetical protein
VNNRSRNPYEVLTRPHDPDLARREIEGEGLAAEAVG